MSDADLVVSIALIVMISVAAGLVYVVRVRMAKKRAAMLAVQNDDVAPLHGSASSFVHHL